MDRASDRLPRGSTGSEETKATARDVRRILTLLKPVTKPNLITSNPKKPLSNIPLITKPTNPTPTKTNLKNPNPIQVDNRIPQINTPKLSIPVKPERSPLPQIIPSTRQRIDPKLSIPIKPERSPLPQLSTPKLSIPVKPERSPLPQIIPSTKQRIDPNVQINKPESNTKLPEPKSIKDKPIVSLKSSFSNFTMRGLLGDRDLDRDLIEYPDTVDALEFYPTTLPSIRYSDL